MIILNIDNTKKNCLGGFMDREYPKNIKTLTYNPRMAEHAQNIKQALPEYLDNGYILAVDLPHGLEKQVGKTIKRLPCISLILDELNRAIPVVPSIGSIEAVRTAKKLGMRTEFMDASLPFLQDQGSSIEIFSDLSVHTTESEYERLIQTPQSEYMDMRRGYMALRVKQLLEEGEKVVMVCNFIHHDSIIDNFQKESEFGCGIVSPPVICHVDQHDVWRISPELPYFLMLYEISRDDLSFNRKEAFIKLFYDSINNSKVSELIKYSRNLAVTDGQIYPDLYNIISSAKFCVNDEYALRILDKALSYPFTELKTDCKFSDLLDYNMNPLKGQRVLEIKTGLMEEADLYLRPRKKESISHGVMILKRPAEDLRKELKFAQYMENHYQACSPGEEFDSEEFQCGFYEGLDIRETLKFKFLDKLYVKKCRKENDTAYVVNYGGMASHTIYFDTQSSVIGAARSGKSSNLVESSLGESGNLSYPDGLCWTCFTLFSQKPEGGTEKMLDQVNIFDPLQSCLRLALDNAQHVFLFNQEPILYEFTEQERNRISCYDIDKLPINLAKNMKCFNLRWIKD